MPDKPKHSDEYRAKLRRWRHLHDIDQHLNALTPAQRQEMNALNLELEPDELAANLAGVQA